LSVLKSRDTSLLESEKKSFRTFLIFYFVFSLVVMIFSGVIYYNSQKELLFERQNSKLKSYSSKLIKELEHMHNNFHDGIVYPRFEDFNSAIYDSSGKLIFSTLKQKSVNLNSTIYNKDGKTHYIRLLNSFYLGAMYVVIEIDDIVWGNFLTTYTVFWGVLLFAILLVAGYFFAKLMLKPMRDSLYLLDRFIKDTTHELNTPITSIMTNIEMIDTSIMADKNLRKLQRIEVAGKTISHLYEDLTFVSLGNKTERKDETVDIKELLKQRGEFFKTLADSKKIQIEYQMDDSELFIDKKMIARVMDNLLSNAIKYNKRAGFIKITSTKNSFSIEDSGIGIKKKDLDSICQRYARFNDSEGGFGIGLSIVNAIVKEYGLDIEFSSEFGKGTKVVISW